MDFNSFNTYQKINYVVQNIQALTGLLGIVGNILVICVFCRKRLRKFSYSFYCIMLACSDIIVLLHSIRHWAKLVLNADIDTVGTFFCKFGEYQPYVTSSMSLWLITLISVDRLATVVYPKRFKVLKSRWFQVLLFVLVLTFSMLIFIQMPLNYELVVRAQRGSNTSESSCELPFQVSTDNTWVFLANLFFAAIVVNNILSVKLIRFIVLSRRRVSLRLNQVQNQSTSRDRKFALCSIGLNVCCFVCKFPLAVCLLLSNYLHLSLDRVQMMFTIAVTFGTIDNGITIFINLFINSFFYDELLRMLGRKTASDSVASQSRSISRRMTIKNP